MTAATLTAEDVASDLIGELRALLDRHSDLTALDEIRELADELTATLRRTRGRITRLVRQATPKTPPPGVAKTPPAPAARPAPWAEPKAEPAPKAARPAAGRTPERAPAAEPAVAQAAPRRITTARYILTAIAVVCTRLRTRVAHSVRRAAAALRALARHPARLIARAERESDEPEECIICGPGCCSPIAGYHADCPGPRADATVVSLR